MTSAIVVGSGIAGLSAALHAARAGVEVTIVAKGALADTATRWAQGGIAAVLTRGDSVGAHVADTLRAGDGLCDEDAVRVLASEGPDRVRELIALGVAFDRDADGALRMGLEAAHSHARILHAGGDATGRAIEEVLVAAARASRARILEHTRLIDLVDDGDRVGGVRVLADGAVRELRADAVVLATGGAGRLYSRTTNPELATGDGIAAASRAGAAVADLEFVQFHPTVLAAGAPFLVSEAVRGEGAVLVDETGRRFAFDDHPDGELAPRDVVARSIARRMAAQGGRPVLLDATALGRAALAARFPTITAAVAARGFDWAETAVPVTPAAHYLMGGVVTDLHGRTTRAGLLAVGECARTGVHGANRLASNSLLEGAVFGARAAAALADATAASAPAAPGPAAPVPPDPDAPPFSREALQRLMWDEVGLVRDGARLLHAAGILAAWDAALPAPRTPRAHEDAALVRVGALAASAALARTESAGAHHRADAVRPAPEPALATAGAPC
ncbi:L-aspartate oxidase [Microbacterium sp. NPDC055683]